MLSLRSRILFLAAVISGCAPTQEAPTDLGDLTLFLFSEFETAEDAYLADALMNLETGALLTVDLEGARIDRQWVQPILTEDHRGGATGPPPAEVDPALQVSVTVAGLSSHPLTTHAEGVLIADQSELEPSAPEHDRTFTVDTACWSDGSCGRIDTENHIKKSNFLYTIIYDAEKDYRRMLLPDGRQAMIARSWNEESVAGEEGINSIDQNYATEVFIEDSSDSSRTLRMMAIWTSVTLAADPTDDLVRGTIGLGIDGLFNRHDEFYSESD